MQTNRSIGVTLLATVLILNPLLQWLFLLVLSTVTILEAPFTHSTGLGMAMQMFFAPGNIIGVLLGIGLLSRSEWARRIALGVFVITLLLDVYFIYLQFASQQFNSSLIVIVAALLFCAFYFWYFTRPAVKAEFKAGTRAQPLASARAMPQAASAVPAPERSSMGVIIAACFEALLSLGALALVYYAWTVFIQGTSHAGVAQQSLSAEQEVLHVFLFCAIALLLLPHALTLWSAIALLFRQPAAPTAARRWSALVCWTSVGCFLLVVWLASMTVLEFDVRNALLLGGFCILSLVWHLCFIVIARRRPMLVSP